MTVNLDTGDITLMRDMSEKQDGTDIQYVPIDQIDWPEDENDEIQGLQKTVIDDSIRKGGRGLAWDEMHGNYMSSEISNSIKNVSESAFRSYFFGGTIGDYGKGKMVESSPAAMIMKEKFYDFNTGEWVEGYEPGSAGYAGYLEFMKNSGNFGKDSQYRKRTVDLIYNAAKAYHDNSYSNWENKQRKNEGNHSGRSSNKIEVLETWKERGVVDRKAGKIKNNEVVYDWEGNKFEPKDGGYVDPGGNWYSKEDLLYGPYFGIGDRAEQLYPNILSNTSEQTLDSEVAEVEEVDEIPGENKKENKKKGKVGSGWYSRLFRGPKY